MLKKRKKIILAVSLSSVLIIAIVITALVVSGLNKKADVPIENAGQSTVLETDKSPEELTPQEVAYAYIFKQNNLQSYKLDSKGQTVANILGGYVQEVADVGYKFGDEIYLQNVSTSKFATVDHEAFVKTVDGVSKVAYRDKGGNISVSERDGEKGYKSVYGISPDDSAIGGYIINGNTLKAAERLADGNRYELKEEYAGDLQYHFSVDPCDEATAYAQLQMAEYGGLSAAPSFQSIDLYLTISDDWTPRELITHAIYDAEKNIGMSMSFTCTQDITATYSEVNAITANPIPDTDKFNGAIGSQPATEAQSGGEAALSDVMSAFMDVFNALTAQNWERGVKLGLSLDLNMFSREDDEVLNIISAPFTADIYAKYNPTAIESGAYLNAVNFRVDADLEGISDILNVLEIAPAGSIPAYVTQMNGVSVCYTGNGYPAVIIKNAAGDFVYATELDVAGLILPLLSGNSGAAGSISKLDLGAVVDFINESFTLETRETGRVLVLSDDKVLKLDEGYATLVEKLSGLVAEASGNLGSLAGGAIKNYLGAEITGVEIAVGENENGVTGLSVNISGKPFHNFDENAPGITLVSLSLDFCGDMTDEEIADLADDGAQVKEIMKKEKTAELYRAKVQTLVDEMWLGESYKRRVRNTAAEIEALAPDVKSLVFNYGQLESNEGNCIETHDKYMEEVQEFLSLIPQNGDWSDFEFWADLEGLYNGRIENVRCQREYIGEKVIGDYLKARAERT